MLVMLAALGWLVAAVAMTALWAWQRRRRDAGIAAAMWPALVGTLAVLDANLGDGAWVRRSAIAWMMGSWGARLAVQGIYTRAARRADGAEGSPEGLRDKIAPDIAEATPERLRDKVAPHTIATRDVRTLWLFQALAAAAVIASLPALLASLNRDPNLSVVELAACGLWVAGFAGETTADRQRLRFTSNPANEGLRCRTGLWRYSRYADRIFEALIWVAYAIFGLTAVWPRYV